MTIDPNHAVSDALYALRDGLDPFLQEAVAPHTGGLDWPMVLKALDIDRGKSGSYPYQRTDVALQLRMITEPLGNLRYFFSTGDPHRVLSTFGNELRIVRKRSAHNEDFQPFEALRAVDTVRIVLDHIGDDIGAEAMLELRSALLAGLTTHSSDAGPELDSAQVDAVIEEQLEPRAPRSGERSVSPQTRLADHLPPTPEPSRGSPGR